MRVWSLLIVRCWMDKYSLYRIKLGPRWYRATSGPASRFVVVFGDVR